MKHGIMTMFAGLGWAALCLLCACDVSIPSGSLGIADETGPRALCGGGGNRCPEVEVGSYMRNAPPGSLVTLDATASSDPDGDAVFCAWQQVSGPRSLGIETEPGNGCLASVMPTEQGTYQFTVSVTDGRGGSAGATVELMVTENPEEDAPWADAGEDRSVDEGRGVTLRGGNSADPNGDPLDFAWMQVAGPEVSLAGRFTAEPSFTAPFVDHDTDLVFRLTVDDEFYYSSDEVIIIVQDLDYQDNANENDNTNENDNENQNANENDNSAEPECVTDADCDDGQFCNGEETCVDGECSAGASPCPDDETCNEEADTCAAAPECTTDADCDDGLFCDGVELCDTTTGKCVSSGNPCRATYLISSETYDSDADNILAEIQAAYGPGATLAEWNDIKAEYGGSASSIQQFMGEIGMSDYDDDGVYWVTHNGSEFWSGRRHYHATRQNGNYYDWFLYHDDIQGRQMALGSWWGTYPALVRLPGVGSEGGTCNEEQDTCRSTDSLQGVWHQIATSGGPPADRQFHSAIYNAVARRMIIFGGWSGSFYNSCNDTWALDLSTNVWSQVSTTGGPPATRAGHVAVYDSSRHRMVIYGGHNWWTSWRNDTWALDLSSSTWTQLSTTGGPPPARYGHGGFYDTARDRIIIFGGYAGGSSQHNDTWSLDLSTLVWTEIATSAGPPPARHAFGAIYDTANDQFVIAGGSWGRGDAWVLNLASHTWTQVASAPYGFGGVSSAFDGETGWMIIVGGEEGTPAPMPLVFDVWSNTWFEVNVPGATPPIRRNAPPSAIFDPVASRTIMFGGGTPSLSETFNDTWELFLTGQR